MLRERIQKVLSAQGIGSRREVEAWIEAGRITINKEAAKPGQAIGPKDDVRLDGRRLRLYWGDPSQQTAVVYHRPAHEGMRSAVEGTDRSSLERLPKAPGGRWIPVSPMGIGEGGLELFVSDGHLAAALMSHADKISSEYSVRVRGDLDESRLPELVAAAARDVEARGRVDEIELTGGEAANRWVRLVTVGLRPRDLKRVFEDCGIEANRIIRTRFGPIGMDRSLARGVSRRLTTGELATLADAAGLKAEPKKSPRAGRSAARRPAARKPGGRKPGGRRGH
jgi:23S rRNA pseudouridine2605 synthase